MRFYIYFYLQPHDFVPKYMYFYYSIVRYDQEDKRAEEFCIRLGWRMHVLTDVYGD
jgi:hypothetical protein